MYKLDIEDNKRVFCDLLRKIDRENSRIDDLIAMLEGSDFFTAPASTKFHNAVEGGLADHSLNVYYNLKSLVERKHIDCSENSVLICGLLHDISKINFYKKTSRNKKVYSEDGSKWDNLGRFDWVSELSYTIAPPEERFIYGNHEENSEYLIRQFIVLSNEESIAILHHHGGMSWDSCKFDMQTVYNISHLALLLHVADMIACYVDEGCNE